MNILIEVIDQIVAKYYLNETQADCNYQDNYYGDQVCTISSTKR